MPTQKISSPWTKERAAKVEIEIQKRESVIQAAAVSFARNGYHGTTMDQIAEMLDISKPTLYKYYKNKSELLHACDEKATERFLELARECVELDGTALDKIKHYQYRSVEFLTDEFGRALALMEETGLDPEGRQHWHEARDEITKIFRKIVGDGIKKEEINPMVDPRLTMLALFGAFNFIAKWFKPDGSYTAHEICDQFFEVFINGLKP
jgi:AcrR family transcriptional regulator